MCGVSLLQTWRIWRWISKRTKFGLHARHPRHKGIITAGAVEYGQNDFPEGTFTQQRSKQIPISIFPTGMSCEYPLSRSLLACIFHHNHYDGLGGQRSIQIMDILMPSHGSLCFNSEHDWIQVTPSTYPISHIVSWQNEGNVDRLGRLRSKQCHHRCLTRSVSWNRQRLGPTLPPP